MRVPQNEGQRQQAIPSDYVLKLAKVSDTVHKVTELTTSDREDHTFSGIMFNIETQHDLPLAYVKVDSFWVRGALGPVSVYITNAPTPAGYRGLHDDPDSWRKVFDRNLSPSLYTLVELRLEEPLYMFAGDVYGVYIHSRQRGDQAIVYDNTQRSSAPSRQDGVFKVQTQGMAHVSSIPFMNAAPWGWGRGWRNNREFVGKVSYGIKFQLWKPDQETHSTYPASFREVVFILLAGQHRDSSILSWLPVEMVFYIINKLNYNDCPGSPEPKHKKGLRALSFVRSKSAQPQKVQSAVISESDNAEQVHTPPPPARRPSFSFLNKVARRLSFSSRRRERSSVDKADSAPDISERSNDHSSSSSSSSSQKNESNVAFVPLPQSESAPLRPEMVELAAPAQDILDTMAEAKTNEACDHTLDVESPSEPLADSDEPRINAVIDGDYASPSDVTDTASPSSLFSFLESRSSAGLAKQPDESSQHEMPGDCQPNDIAESPTQNTSGSSSLFEFLANQTKSASESKDLDAGSST